MRWSGFKGTLPHEGDMRYRTLFLLFPLCLDREWRWMEFATVREYYRVNRPKAPGWRATTWIQS